MSSDEERLLVHKAQQGDQAALGALWDAITPRLYGYLVNTTRDKALAEDLLSATWLKAVQALAKFKSQGQGISPWLFAIARNELRQHWRRSKGELAFDPLVHDIPSPDDQESENQLLVEQILNDLSEDDRELLRLRYIADLSTNDLARALNLNFITVRVRLSRALHKARLILQKYEQ